VHHRDSVDELVEKAVDRDAGREQVAGVERDRVATSYLVGVAETSQECSSARVS